MATFVKGALETVVWDPDKGKPLAVFEDGKFKTSDSEVAERLIALGYRRLKEFKDGPPAEGFVPKKDPDFIDVTDKDIRAAKTESQAMAQTGKAPPLPEERESDSLEDLLTDDEDLDIAS